MLKDGENQEADTKEEKVAEAKEKVEEAKEKIKEAKEAASKARGAGYTYDFAAAPAEEQSISEHRTSARSEIDCNLDNGMALPFPCLTVACRFALPSQRGERISR